MGLRNRQKRFIEEYLVDYNGAQAAIRAGYSKKTAKEQACQQLTKPAVQEALAAALKAISDSITITRERWLKELELCGFSDMREYVEICEDTGSVRAKGFDAMPPMASRAIRKVKEKRIIREAQDGQSTIIDATFEFELHNKLTALKDYGEAAGFITPFQKNDPTEQKGFVPVENYDPDGI